MRGRWTIVALVLSLAVNLFLVGAGAGMLATGARHAHERPGPGRPAPLLRRAIVSLPPERRAALIAAVRDDIAGVRPAAREARALRQGVWASLAEPGFDAAAAKQKLDQARALDRVSRGKIEDGIIDFVANLPPDERAAFGRAMAHSLPPAPGPGGPGGPRGPEGPRPPSAP